MAKLRFPGRPVRFDRITLKYFADDIKNTNDPSLAYLPQFQYGLRLFREIVGASDEEEDFEGFTKAELKKGEKKLAAVQDEQAPRPTRTRLSASPPSSDYSRTRITNTRLSLDASSSVEGTRGRGKAIVRLSYKDIETSKFAKPTKSQKIGKAKNDASEKTPKRCKTTLPFPRRQFKLDYKHDVPGHLEPVGVKKTEKDMAKFLLEKAKQANLLKQQKIQKQRERKLKPVKKQFVLPTQSSRSSRVIKPNKRFLEEYVEHSVMKKSRINKDSSNLPPSDADKSLPFDQSLPSFSSPVSMPTSPGNQVLIVDGKRDRKPSLKMRLKDEAVNDEMNYFTSPKTPKTSITSPLAAPKLGTCLFSSQTQFQKVSEKQKFGMMGLGSARKQGASIVQKAKLQLNRAAINKSKAALARSLKATMKREAKTEAEQEKMLHSPTQSSFTSPQSTVLNEDVQQKPPKPKKCPVCGKKTDLSFSLKVIWACIQCRNFFMKAKHKAARNILKIRCKFKGKCKLSATDKRICAYCRLSQCIKVGFPQSDSLMSCLVSPQDKQRTISSPPIVYPQSPTWSPTHGSVESSQRSKVDTEQAFREQELSPIQPGEGSERKKYKKRAFKELLRIKQEQHETGDTDNTPKPVPEVITLPVSPTVGSVEESPQGGHGPRIKHVCRNAAVVLGKPPATFPEKSELRLSALPTKDKVQLWKKDEAHKAASQDSDDECPLEEIIQKSGDSVVVMKKSPPNKYKGPRKLMGPGGTQLYKRKIRCRRCAGCVTPDCGKCRHCMDRPKFGGPGVIKQACLKRRCENPTIRRSALPAFINPKKDFTDSGTDSNAGSIHSSPDKRFSDVESIKLPDDKPDDQTVPGQMGIQPVTGLQSQTGTLLHDYSTKTMPASWFKPKVGTSQTSTGIREAGNQMSGSGVGSEVRRLNFGDDSQDFQLERIGGNRSGKISSRLMKKLSQQQKYDKVEKDNDNQCYPVTLTSVIPASRQWGSAQSQPKYYPIKVDFRGRCDINAVWNYGMALTMSVAMSVRALCYLCGSAGKHELLYCNICCEPFHNFCLDDDEQPTAGQEDEWICARCQFCHVCGGRNNLLQCDKCQNTYHPGCLGPNYPTKPSKKKKIWICTKCVKCKSCGATTPGTSSNATWTYDFSLCYECGQLMDKGNYCPICLKCYSDDDWESKMIQCNMCESWVHSKCEGLTDEMYEILSYLPEDLSFYCRKCHPVGCPEWESTLKREMRLGIENILQSLILSKSAQYILRQEKKKVPLKAISQQGETTPEKQTAATRSILPAITSIGTDSRSCQNVDNTTISSTTQNNVTEQQTETNAGTDASNKQNIVINETENLGESTDLQKVDKHMTEPMDVDALPDSDTGDKGNGSDVKVQQEHLDSVTGDGSDTSEDKVKQEHKDSVKDDRDDASEDKVKQEHADKDDSLSVGSFYGGIQCIKEPASACTEESNKAKNVTLSEESSICDNTGNVKLTEVSVHESKMAQSQGDVECATEKKADECRENREKHNCDMLPETEGVTLQDTTTCDNSTDFRPRGVDGQLDVGTDVGDSKLLNYVNSQDSLTVGQTCDHKNNSDNAETGENKANTAEDTVGDSAKHSINTVREGILVHAGNKQSVSNTDKYVTSSGGTGVGKEVVRSVHFGATTVADQQVEGSVQHGGVRGGQEVARFVHFSASVKTLDEQHTKLDPPEDDHPQDLMELAAKMKTGYYKSVALFCEDLLRIIQTYLDDDEEVRISRKKAVASAKSIFVKQMQQIFPWFKVKACRYWYSCKNLPIGMMPDATLPPSTDHTYAQWLERSAPPVSPQPSPFKKRSATPVKKFMPIDDDEGDMQTFLDGEDTRRCMFCLQFGDQEANDAGRLLYCGQDDWCHVNCALWSAEVYEDANGALKNLIEAHSRAKMLRCDVCQRTGATVGCNTRGCKANYHFMCARRDRCVFQEDKKVFCYYHNTQRDGELLYGDKFSVLRRVFVEEVKIRSIKKSWSKGLNSVDISVLIGSCCVENLGRLTDLSDKSKYLHPADLMTSRMYWSTRDARRRTVYSCRIIEVRPEALKSPAINIRDMRIVHDKSHPDYVPLSTLDLSGVNLACDISQSSQSTCTATESIDLTVDSHSTNVHDTMDISVNRSLDASQCQSFNDSSLAAQETGIKKSVLVQSNSFSGTKAENVAAAKEFLSKSWPVQKKAQPSPSVDLSRLSAKTLKMLNIKDPNQYVQSRQNEATQDGDDDLGLLKVADRLNSAAARCASRKYSTSPLPSLVQMRRRSASVERTVPDSKTSASPTPSGHSHSLISVGKRPSTPLVLCKDILQAVPSRPFSPPIRMQNRAHSADEVLHPILTQKVHLETFSNEKVSTECAIRRPRSVSDPIISPEPKPVSASSPFPCRINSDINAVDRNDQTLDENITSENITSELSVDSEGVSGDLAEATADEGAETIIVMTDSGESLTDEEAIKIVNDVLEQRNSFSSNESDATNNEANTGEQLNLDEPELITDSNTENKITAIEVNDVPDKNSGSVALEVCDQDRAESPFIPKIDNTCEETMRKRHSSKSSTGPPVEEAKEPMMDDFEEEKEEIGGNEEEEDENEEAEEEPMELDEDNDIAAQDDDDDDDDDEDTDDEEASDMDILDISESVNEAAKASDDVIKESGVSGINENDKKDSVSNSRVTVYDIDDSIDSDIEILDLNLGEVSDDTMTEQSDDDRSLAAKNDTKVVEDTAIVTRDEVDGDGSNATLAAAVGEQLSSEDNKNSGGCIEVADSPGDSLIEISDEQGLPILKEDAKIDSISPVEYIEVDVENRTIIKSGVVCSLDSPIKEVLMANENSIDVDDFTDSKLQTDVDDSNCEVINVEKEVTPNDEDISIDMNDDTNLITEEKQQVLRRLGLGTCDEVEKIRKSPKTPSPKVSITMEQRLTSYKQSAQTSPVKTYPLRKKTISPMRYRHSDKTDVEKKTHSVETVDACVPELPVLDPIAKKIKEESLAKSCPEERGPFKCEMCRRLYRTEFSYKTHAANCNFYVSSSDEEDNEDEDAGQDEEKRKEKRGRRRLKSRSEDKMTDENEELDSDDGNETSQPRSSLRRSTIFQRVALQVEEKRLKEDVVVKRRGRPSLKGNNIEPDCKENKADGPVVGEDIAPSTDGAGEGNFQKKRGRGRPKKERPEDTSVCEEKVTDTDVSAIEKPVEAVDLTLSEREKRRKSREQKQLESQTESSDDSESENKPHEVLSTSVPRRRGRPRKSNTDSLSLNDSINSEGDVTMKDDADQSKKEEKIATQSLETEEVTPTSVGNVEVKKRGRGRPKKQKQHNICDENPAERNEEEEKDMVDPEVTPREARCLKRKSESNTSNEEMSSPTSPIPSKRGRPKRNSAVTKDELNTSRNDSVEDDSITENNDKDSDEKRRDSSSSSTGPLIDPVSGFIVDKITGEVYSPSRKTQLNEQSNSSKDDNTQVDVSGEMNNNDTLNIEDKEEGDLRECTENIADDSKAVEDAGRTDSDMLHSESVNENVSEPCDMVDGKDDMSSEGANPAGNNQHEDGKSATELINQEQSKDDNNSKSEIKETTTVPVENLPKTVLNLLKEGHKVVIRNPKLNKSFIWQKTEKGYIGKPFTKKLVGKTTKKTDSVTEKEKMSPVEDSNTQHQKETHRPVSTDVNNIASKIDTVPEKPVSISTALPQLNPVSKPQIQMERSDFLQSILKSTFGSTSHSPVQSSLLPISSVTSGPLKADYVGGFVISSASGSVTNVRETLLNTAPIASNILQNSLGSNLTAFNAPTLQQFSTSISNSISSQYLHGQAHVLPLMNFPMIQPTQQQIRLSTPLQPNLGNVPNPQIIYPQVQSSLPSGQMNFVPMIRTVDPGVALAPVQSVNSSGVAMVAPRQIRPALGTLSTLAPVMKINQGSSVMAASQSLIRNTPATTNTSSLSSSSSQLNLQKSINDLQLVAQRRVEKMHSYMSKRKQSVKTKNQTQLPNTMSMLRQSLQGKIMLDAESNGVVIGQISPNLKRKKLPVSMDISIQKGAKRGAGQAKNKKLMKRKYERKIKQKDAIAQPHATDKYSHPIIHPQKEATSLPVAAVEEEVRDVPLTSMDDPDNGQSTASSKVNMGYLEYEITSDDGFTCRSDTLDGAWKQVFEKVQDARTASRMKQLSYAGLSGSQMFGLTHEAVVYLVEQLYGANYCRRYKFKYHKHALAEQELELVNPSGCIRTEPFSGRNPWDMFSFLMSRYRKLPVRDEKVNNEEMIQKSSRRATSMDLPMAMRFRKLKEHSREAVGVYRSTIHGRGLFCKRNIDAGEMVIEYAGEVIRNSMTDLREKYYESKGIGCYMFRIDDMDVVDATMRGSAARFINHSCEPNCYSKVITVDNRKHIVIFAIRQILRGEELTYDYKFPIEEVKIMCTCGSKKCRKYLN